MLCDLIQVVSVVSYRMNETDSIRAAQLLVAFSLMLSASMEPMEVDPILVDVAISIQCLFSASDSCKAAVNMDRLNELKSVDDFYEPMGIWLAVSEVSADTFYATAQFFSIINDLLQERKEARKTLVNPDDQTKFSLKKCKNRLRSYALGKFRREYILRCEAARMLIYAKYSTSDMWKFRYPFKSLHDALLKDTRNHFKNDQTCALERSNEKDIPLPDIKHSRWDNTKAAMAIDRVQMENADTHQKLLILYNTIWRV